MSTTAETPTSSPEVDSDEARLTTGYNEVEVYQALSRAAVLSLVFGCLSVFAFLSQTLVVLPLLGIVFGLVGFASLRKYPDELLGKPQATWGLTLSLMFLVAAPAYHIYVYATEVPEGYERVKFSSLQSVQDEIEGMPVQPPPEAMALDGKQIFIKGYIHPNSMDATMAKRFVLVPDLGTCCFGGVPDLTDMIEVSLSGEDYAQKTLRQQKLAGELTVRPTLKRISLEKDNTGVFYQLKADYINK